MAYCHSCKIKPRTKPSEILKKTIGTKAPSKLLYESATQTYDSPPCQDNHIITELVAELAIILNDKANLESQNAVLKVECSEYKQRLINLDQTAAKEKHELLQTFKKTQDDIREKEMTFSQKDLKCLEEQKKYLIEINRLKTSYCDHKEYTIKLQNELNEKIAALQLQLQISKSSHLDLKTAASNFEGKSRKYKGKLKYAINVIKELNQIISQCYVKTDKDHKESQTECDKGHEEESVAAIYPPVSESENLVISELFFKANPFNDSVESLFFNHASDCDSCEGDLM